MHPKDRAVQAFEEIFGAAPEHLARALGQAYLRQTGLKPEITICRASALAGLLE